MLSAEDNEILTRVGPGTPMGDLLRRYWIPACLSVLDDHRADPVLRQADLRGPGGRRHHLPLRENDYQIDRFAQKGTSYSGIADFRSQEALGHVG